MAPHTHPKKLNDNKFACFYPWVSTLARLSFQLSPLKSNFRGKTMSVLDDVFVSEACYVSFVFYPFPLTSQIPRTAEQTHHGIWQNSFSSFFTWKCMLLHEDAMNILFTRLFLAVLCLNGRHGIVGDNFFERTVEIQYSPRAFLIRSTFYLGHFFTVRFLPFCDLPGRARCYRWVWKVSPFKLTRETNDMQESTGAHFSKNLFHVSCLFHKSHLASEKCEMWVSFPISHFTNHEE